MVMIAMRYMWSEIDSGSRILKRFQPSRGVVFTREMWWRKGSALKVELGGVVGRGEVVESLLRAEDN